MIQISCSTSDQMVAPRINFLHLRSNVCIWSPMDERLFTELILRQGKYIRHILHTVMTCVRARMRVHV